MKFLIEVPNNEDVSNVKNEIISVTDDVVEAVYANPLENLN
jgi:hypothetical protein